LIHTARGPWPWAITNKRRKRSEARSCERSCLCKLVHALKNEFRSTKKNSTHSALSLTSSNPLMPLPSSCSESAPSLLSSDASRCGVVTPAEMMVPSTEDLDTSEPCDAVLVDLRIPRPADRGVGEVGDDIIMGLIGERGDVPGIVTRPPRPRPRPMLCDGPSLPPWGMGPGRCRPAMVCEWLLCLVRRADLPRSCHTPRTLTHVTHTHAQPPTVRWALA
jgi:hypothetical protein